MVIFLKKTKKKIKNLKKEKNNNINQRKKALKKY